jgi:hypothetical protein
MGVVDTRHGSGTQVADSGSDVLKTPLEFLLMLDRPSIEDLVETRTLLESTSPAARPSAARDGPRRDGGGARDMKANLARPIDVTDPTSASTRRSPPPRTTGCSNGS